MTKITTSQELHVYSSNYFLLCKAQRYSSNYIFKIKNRLILDCLASIYIQPLHLGMFHMCICIEIYSKLEKGRKKERNQVVELSTVVDKQNLIDNYFNNWIILEQFLNKYEWKWMKFADSSFWNVLTCFFTLYYIIVNLNVLDKIRYLRTSTIWLILTLAVFDRFEELHKVFYFSHLSVWNQQKIFSRYLRFSCDA